MQAKMRLPDVQQMVHIVPLSSRIDYTAFHSASILLHPSNGLMAGSKITQCVPKHLASAWSFWLATGSRCIQCPSKRSMFLLGCGSYLRLWLDICRAASVNVLSISCLLLIVGVGRLGARLPNDDICKRIIGQRKN